ncbi:enoyl-CoA hydratase/isomerase family protein [Rhodothermus profundi]|uniref:Short chain enoyl-CoA hydratase n=1 Tax=Rhodothermus profundi TaxID=633813 RepID=A0A1M6Q3E6_9BACT|nr:enoyl-CoA hydratase-related protein [Rhodothermus profundi]SHK14752.1 short chain enoyl-CoA hydratase [Rhodothermus profundi]
MTETFQFATLLVEEDEQGIVCCTFNRPEVRNALNLEMVQEVRQLLDQLARRDAVRVLIFTGAGGQAFVSGADIAELRERGRAEALQRINNSLFREIEQFPAPTIAAVRGWALGGGCELAMACDLRIAGESARFGQPEVRLGIIPGAGATYRLPRLVGLGKARELIYTGRIIEASEALAIGLVNEVVPDDQVLEKARALAREIAAASPLAVRFAKMALNAAFEMSTDVGLTLETMMQAILFEDEEKYRRMTAFLERKQRKQKA